VIKKCPVKLVGTVMFMCTQCDLPAVTTKKDLNNKKNAA
jgi:hypothetical protein